MSDTTQTNAMAEIALALAMGFFSIMVLTMVSMGSGMVAQKSSNALENPIALAASQPNQRSEKAEGDQNVEVKSEDLVIFFQGIYFDADLKPLAPASLHGRDKVVLAVAPTLALNDAIKARNAFDASDLSVVPLSDNWLNALKEISK